LEHKSNKKFLDRLNKSFPLEDKEQADQYIADLSGVWKEVSSSIRSTVILIVVAMTLFELLSRAAVEEMSFGPVKIKDLALVEKLIPVVVAYLFYQLVSQYLRWRSMEITYNYLMTRFHSAISGNNFDLLLYPSMPALFDLNRSAGEGSKLVDMQYTLGLVLIAIFMGIPFAFEVYAYYRIIVTDAFDVLGVVGSLLSAALVFAAYWMLRLFSKDETSRI
jgi:hypothetical protein